MPINRPLLSDCSANFLSMSHRRSSSSSVPSPCANSPSSLLLCPFSSSSSNLSASSPNRSSPSLSPSSPSSSSSSSPSTSAHQASSLPAVPHCCPIVPLPVHLVASLCRHSAAAPLFRKAHSVDDSLCPRASSGTLPLHRRRWRRRAAQQKASSTGSRRERGGREALVLLLLQFLWVLPYLCVANYMERWLLPLRLYCYTDSDLLHVRRPLRTTPESCSAHFFANAFHGHRNKLAAPLVPEQCGLNRTLEVLLKPWKANIEGSGTRRVVVIRSAPRAAEYREFIRASWKTSVERLCGPVIFVSGRDGSDLGAENAQHGDILQLDFEDSYRNLTLKMMGIYRFFTERTPVEQIAVINDDTIVNATALSATFSSTEAVGSADGRYLIGKVSRGYPRLVFPWLPWYIPAHVYPHKCYPPFVQGSSFVISRIAAAEVLRRVCEFPVHGIQLDDILMGVLTNCLGIANLHREGFDVGHSLAAFTVFHYQFFRYSAEHLTGIYLQIKHTL